MPRSFTDICTNIIYAAKDDIYHNLRDKDIIVVKGDKGFSIVTAKRSDYVTQLDAMINDGVMKGTYIETTDNML